MAPPATGRPSEVSLFLAGDVMTGRGIDQILPHPGDPELREVSVHSAHTYVELAEATSGAIPRSVEPGYIWGDGLEVLRAHRPDASIVNLETSITTSGAFWPAKPVHYRMHPANAACLRIAGIDACGLANNHVLDFGPPGLADTLTSLRELGIEPAGAGRDLEEARRPAMIMVGQHARVLLAAVGSTTSGIPASWAASSSRPGVDLLRDLSEATARDVAERLEHRRQPGDIAVVSIHWGSNWGYEITPEMRRFARALVDGGVDLVHGHSSHHLRPIEVYRGKLVVYGAGDLITDYEGIDGYETFRGDLGAMFFPSLSTRDGTLTRLRVVPMQMKRLRLSRPSSADIAWFETMLRDTCAPFGAHFEPTGHGELALSAAGP